MCAPRNQEQWIEWVNVRNAQAEEDDTTFATEFYYNATGQRALLMRESDGWQYVVPNEDGTDRRTFDPEDDGVDAGVSYLRSIGYIFDETEGKQEAEQSPTLSPNEEKFIEVYGAENLDKVYDGHTLREWIAIGERNEELEGDQHTHPKEPEGVVTDEIKELYTMAVATSMTSGESLMMLMQLTMSGAGPFGMSGGLESLLTDLLTD